MVEVKIPKLTALVTILERTTTVVDSTIHKLLDEAFKEYKLNAEKHSELKEDLYQVFFRNIVFIGDVSRQHNILSELGIKSPSGGSQNRAVFRSILRWWVAKAPDSFYRNLRVIAEFTNYENLMYYAQRTDRRTGKLLSFETVVPDPQKVYAFLKERIAEGNDLALIAKWTPKYMNQNTRTAHTIAKRDGDFTIPKEKSWFKVNGEFIKQGGNGPDVVAVSKGDKISYPRNIQENTKKLHGLRAEWIKGFVAYMKGTPLFPEGTIEEYNEFRKLQGTAEQALSSKSIKDMTKDVFLKFMTGLPSSSRFLVTRNLTITEDGVARPDPKWGNCGVWLLEYEQQQKELLELARKATGEEKKAIMDKVSVKTVGVKSIDILSKLVLAKDDETVLNNTWDALMAKIPMDVSVYPILDRSGSMGSINFNGRSGWGSVDHNGVGFSPIQVATLMALAFSTNLPQEDLRNTFGIFADRGMIVGRNKFVSTRPNKFMAGDYTTAVKEEQLIHHERPFTENWARLRSAMDTFQIGYSTNVQSVISLFQGFVSNGMHVEELPQALLIISDGCFNNQGSGFTSLMAAQNAARKLGWDPLFVVWDVVEGNGSTYEWDGFDNMMGLGGFSEGVLTQIFKGLKDGPIDPQTRIWSLLEDTRYNPIS